MSMSGDREFSLPRRKRVPWWLWAVAAAVHVPLFLLLIWSPRTGRGALLSFRSVILGDSVAEVRLPSVRPGPRPPRIARSTPAPAARLPQAVTAAAPLPEPTSIAALTMPVDTPPHGAAAGLRPHYGDGRLWVEPLPETPRQMASAMTGKKPGELSDTSVARLIQTYLDQMAEERAESPTALPSWTTRIGGKTVGVDQKWIYLGPLKIPTALLALLPIHVQANPTQAEFNAKLQQMRSDLFEAARRSENYEEFKEAVKDLHAQKEREREFKRNQRTRPDTSKHG